MKAGYEPDLTRKPLGRRLACLAATQHGVFTKAQALDAGATETLIKRRCASGQWERLHPRVFRIAGSPPTWRQSLIAACFAWGDGVVVSHRAAAALWRLPGFEPGFVELIVPRGRRRTHSHGIVAHRLPMLPIADISLVEEIPVTAVARTLIDIAAIAAPDILEEAMDDALRRGLVSLPRLRWRLSELGRSGRPGIVVMRALLAARESSSAVPGSVFETRLLRILLEAGIPKPTLQHPIRDGRRTVAVVDFAFPAAQLAIEADGYRWHSGRARWEHDLARRNILTSLGWRVVHITWTDLTSNSPEMINRIRRVLATGAGGSAV